MPSASGVNGMRNEGGINAILELFAKLLSVGAWTRHQGPFGSCVAAIRTVETAVGPKEAMIYGHTADEGRLLVLRAAYRSAGEDLRSEISLIPTCTGAQCERVLSDFIASVERAIDRTYARGLHLRHGNGAFRSNPTPATH